MKKWFVCLLVLLALVLASSTAMALVYEIYCQVCQKSQDYEPTGRYIAAPNEAYHLQIYRCPECGTEQGTGYDLAHEESKAATCISQAYCDLCHKYYGDKDPDNHAYTIVYNKVDEVNHIKEEACSRCKKINYTLTEEHTPKEAATCMSAAICAGCNAAYGSPNPNAHNWSDWQPNLFNSNLHYRYCMNIGCSASESESHDGNSNCVTSATCSKCHTTYKDTTNHVAPLRTHMKNMTSPSTRGSKPAPPAEIRPAIKLRHGTKNQPQRNAPTRHGVMFAIKHTAIRTPTTTVGAIGHTRTKTCITEFVPIMSHTSNMPTTVVMQPALTVCRAWTAIVPTRTRTNTKAERTSIIQMSLTPSTR